MSTIHELLLALILGAVSGFWHWSYMSYWEKLAGDAVLALLLASPALMVYSCDFTTVSFVIKRFLPGQEGHHA